MSIYIKGMEMPISCDECPMFNLDIDGGCYCTKYFVIRKKDQDRPDWCPIVPVPEHGRLIDADAAAKQGWTINRTYSATPTEMVYEVKTMTDEVLPTIIEADVRDNNVGNIPAEEG